MCQTIDVKNLSKIVQSDDKILSSNPTVPFSSCEPSIRVELLDQLKYGILIVSEKVCPIFIHKNLKDKSGSQGVKSHNPFHHSICILKDAGESLKVQESLQSLIVKVIGRMSSPL